MNKYELVFISIIKMMLKIEKNFSLSKNIIFLKLILGINFIGYVKIFIRDLNIIKLRINLHSLNKNKYGIFDMPNQLIKK